MLLGQQNESESLVPQERAGTSSHGQKLIDESASTEVSVSPPGWELSRDQSWMPELYDRVGEGSDSEARLTFEEATEIPEVALFRYPHSGYVI